jgi:hypothetical protein
VIKHISGTANKVVDALSRKCLLLHEFRVKKLGFEDLRDMYRDDPYFQEAYEAAENPVLIDRSSMRENLLKEKHSGGLAGHFGHDKTFAKLNESYFWSGM